MTRHRFVERLLNGPRAGRWRRRPRWVVRRTTQAGPAAQVLASAWPSAVAVAVSSLVASAVLFGAEGTHGRRSLIIVVVPWLAVRRLTDADQARRAPCVARRCSRMWRERSAPARRCVRRCLSRDRADASLRPQLADRVRCTWPTVGALDVALDAWCEREPSEGLRLAVAALTLGLDAGGAPGRALDGVAASLRERLAVDRRAGGAVSAKRGRQQS